MSLGIIGEAAGKVSQEFQDRYPEVPWAKMRDLRNRIIHEYFRLDLGIIWEIATAEIPSVLKLLEPLVPPGHP
jgi:uncharacterized protein with HEPN domain